MKTLLPVIAVLLLGAGLAFGMSRHHATAGHHLGETGMHGALKALSAHGADSIHGAHEMSGHADACPGCGSGDDETPKHGDKKEEKDEDAEPCH